MADAKTFGYARVSAREQNEARQVEALLAAGVGERELFVDKQSGRDFARPKYQALVNTLREGDTVIVTSIDRLGRDYGAILAEWRHITQALRADIRVLDMPLLDTTSTSGSLDGRFVSDLVLQILSYVAEKERENLRARQRQGIDVAKAAGKHLGRPPLAMPAGFGAVYARWKRGEITAVTAMQALGVKKTSFYKMVRAWEAGQMQREGTCV